MQNDQYPRAFSVGGFYVTGTYADPLLNTNGQNRILAGGTAKTDYGLSQVYVQAQQMVYRPDASDRGLTLFGGASVTWIEHRGGHEIPPPALEGLATFARARLGV